MDNIGDMHEKLENNLGKRAAQISSDLELPPAIVAALKNMKRTCDEPDSAGEQRRPGVFLTGANGFVGAFLLNELLQSAKEYSVYCLVRNSGILFISFLFNLANFVRLNFSTRET